MNYPDELVDITNIPTGTILRDWSEDGVRVIVMRSNFSMNVYLGIPLGHPLADLGYDDLNIDCHGGLTFSTKGGKPWPSGYYWYGYDYAHAGDYCWYGHSNIEPFKNDKKWSLGEIVKDAQGPLYDMQRLVKLSESIANKHNV